MASEFTEGSEVDSQLTAISANFSDFWRFSADERLRFRTPV
jgi:hypothetical protein